MNEHFEVNGSVIRAWLRVEGRKHSYICNKLGISSSSLDKILAGRVPREETLNLLAALIGVSVTDLLIPKTEAKTA